MAIVSNATVSLLFLECREVYHHQVPQAFQVLPLPSQGWVSETARQTSGICLLQFLCAQDRPVLEAQQHTLVQSSRVGDSCLLWLKPSSGAGLWSESE